MQYAFPWYLYLICFNFNPQQYGCYTYDDWFIKWERLYQNSHYDRVRVWKNRTACKFHLFLSYVNNKIIQVSYDHPSYECNIYKQVRIEAWKSQDFNGVWTHDLAILVQRSNQLSYEATDVGSWSFVSSNEPVKNRCEVIYEMFLILIYGTFHISLHNKIIERYAVNMVPLASHCFFLQSRAHIDKIGMKYLIKLCYSHQTSPNQNQCWSFVMGKLECSSSWKRQGKTK